MATKPKIAIDAGHYKYTPGKRCLKSIDKNETREWFLNSRIAAMLPLLLSDYECEIMRVDDPTGEKEVGLAERCQKANNWGADIYISIHHNAGIQGGSGGGTVVFYNSSNPVRAKEAQKLYDAIVAQTGLKGNRSQGVVSRGYYVLNNTKMPAFLIENGFMDSKTDTPIILTNEHAEKTAIGLANFVINYFGLKKKNSVPTEPIKEDDEEMTQEQFNEMFNKAMTNYRKSLQDNDSGKWSKDARNWAISTGLIAGGDPLPNGEPNYMWEDMSTREQIVTLLYRFKDLK